MWRMIANFLLLMLVLSFAHPLEASRFKRQGFVFDNGGSSGGEKCVTKDTRENGVCIEIVKCDEATKILVGNPTPAQRRMLQMRTCKFEGNTPFFCCVTGGGQPPPPPPPPTAAPVTQPAPTTTTTTTTTTTVPPKPDVTPEPVSRGMSESELNKVCGKTKVATMRVVGGTPSVLGAWPWMAAIFVGNSFAFVSCGGVLISDQYILTASHCIIDKATNQKRAISDFTIRLGDLDIASNDDEATPIDFKAVELIPHENYNPTTIKNDIALIKLDKLVAKFTDLINPICLPTSPPMSTDTYVGKSPFIAGWGTVLFKGESSSSLRQVMLDVVPTATCQSAFNRFKVTISDTQLCAGILLGGKDACQGDSGGPLMLNDASNKWFSIGVVSVGFQCAVAGFPGIYTRTTAYTDWIKTNANIK